MLFRWYWPRCTYRERRWNAEPIDCFWLEATREEAERQLFQLLGQNKVALSNEMAAKGCGITQPTYGIARPYCFLLAKDLSSIDPFQANYPYANLWNGYSPFREMAERKTRSDFTAEIRSDSPTFRRISSSDIIAPSTD